MTRLWLAALLIGYLPGAIAFRLPIADRQKRAQLSAEERVFWYLMLSVAWSLAVVLALAAASLYRFDRLLIVNAIVSALLVVLARGRLGFRGAAARPSWTVLLPLAIVALGFWRFLPPSEYVIGGKDPGTYMNEGVQLAKRGSIFIRDSTMAAVPESARSLFFPKDPTRDYSNAGFMGFFLLDPTTGTVVGQFPHLFPASIALGYDVAGLDAARLAGICWAVLGLVAVYFAGARLVGRPAAFAAVLLLGVHTMELWFARIPSAEVVIQALLFSVLLAFARAHHDDDRFFAGAAGTLTALLIFLRIDALLAILGLVAAAGLSGVVRRRPPRLGFVLPLAAGGILGWLYLSGPLRAYFWLPLTYLRNLPRAPLAAAVVGGLLLMAALFFLRGRFSRRARAVLPYAFAGTLVLLAGYAMFLRQPAGRLAIADAYALRTFVNMYLLWPAFLAALIGVVLVSQDRFWRDPAFFLVFAAFSVFLFYKVKIVPEHFWMSRRFLPVILPGGLLFAAAAALGPPMSGWPRGWRLARTLAGGAVLVLIGQQYLAAAAPLVPHREYEGMVRAVERLASRFTDRDLVIVESRNAGGDNHVLALPLTYIYDRKVLLLDSPRPDKRVLASFLDDAVRRYDRVMFVGGGGTDLWSRRISATPVADARVQVKEFEVTPWDVYPRGVRRKDFDYSVYQLHLDQPRTGPFVVDVGFEDDLYVVRFHAKEQTEGRTVRWTGKQSFIAVPNLTGGEREAVFVMHDGGRPPQAEPARVEVFFNETPIGTIDVGKGFTIYRLTLPPDVVRRAADQDDPAQLRLLSTVWTPKSLLGGNDDRQLGVMIDRVEIH